MWRNGKLYFQTKKGQLKRKKIKKTIILTILQKLRPEKHQ